ncbi:YybH family protein [Streptomyces sp. LZ34]
MNTPIASNEHPRGTATPQEHAQLFVRYIEERDLDGLVSLYEPKALVQNEPGTALTGTDAIRVGLGQLLDSQAQVKLALRKIHIVDDIALVSHDVTTTAPDGTTHQTVSTEVQRRQANGRWLHVVDDLFFG